MNALIRTTIVFAVISFIAAGSMPAQDIVDENAREALAAQREAQIAQKRAEAAQKQIEAAQRQMEAVQRQAEVERTQALVSALAAQPPEVPVPPRPPATAIPGRGPWSLRTASDGAVLVIPSAEIKAEDVVAITEDMNVMSRILEKNLEQARIATARGGLFASSRDPWVALLGGGGAIESMYLQGYGALFMMKVDFPLSAPPQAEEEETQAAEEEKSDPVWEETRRQMYEPQQTARRKAKEPEKKYDAEKVESLKITLIKALKHAANVRSLKSDESVILTTIGSDESAGVPIMALYGQKVLLQEKGSDGKATTGWADVPSSSQTTYFSPTALVIRAKKSDIDEFAKGTLDADQFRQRVQVLACPYLGGEAGLADPFNSYYPVQGRRYR